MRRKREGDSLCLHKTRKSYTGEGHYSYPYIYKTEIKGKKDTLSIEGDTDYIARPQPMANGEVMPSMILISRAKDVLL